MDNQLIFNIANLYKQEIGSREEFHLNVDQDFDPKDFELASSIDTDVTLMKTEKSILVILENFETQLNTECSRCLKRIKVPIHIKSTERNFYFQKPAGAKTEITLELEDERDLYLSNLKQMELDLSELFRQEILLHFPAFAVCSAVCKGICPECGKERDKADCGHAEIERVDAHDPKEVKKEHIQPFKSLKSLVPKPRIKKH